jgi:hypothetical protein
MITRSPTDDYISRKAGPSGPFQLLVPTTAKFLGRIIREIATLRSAFAWRNVIG